MSASADIIESLFEKRRGNIKPGLDRIRQAYEELGRPAATVPKIVIGGTNGKGSTTAFLVRILEAEGLSVSAYTSPHLVSFSERYWHAGREATLDELTALIRSLKNRLPAEMWAGLSFFELAVIVALLLAAEADPDLLVLEVGLGGIWDATNIFSPIATAVVSIGLDHQEYLGEELHAILNEKLGINRHSVPFVWGGGDDIANDAMAKAVFAEHLRAINPQLLVPEMSEKNAGRIIHLADGRKIIPPPYFSKIPPYLQHNFTIAAQLAEAVLNQLGKGLPDSLLADAGFGFAAYLPTLRGRWSKFLATNKGTKNSYPLLLDVCHNEPGAVAFVKAWQAQGIKSETVLLISILADKKHQQIIEKLAETGAKFIGFGCENSRGWKKEDFQANCPGSPFFSSFADAWQYVTMEVSISDSNFAVCGSVAAIGEVTEIMKSARKNGHLSQYYKFFKLAAPAALLFLLGAMQALAETGVNNADVSIPAAGQLFFDAQQTGINREGNKQIFKGEVVAIGAGVILTADLIELDSVKGTLEASGHVLILTENQVFAGDEVRYWIGTEDFEIINANMISQDASRSSQLTQRVLGFSPQELDFEKSRGEQLNTIVQNKERLRDRFRREHGDTENVPVDYIDNYALLLEQEDTVRSSENPALAKLSAERRKVFENRRKYWNLGKGKAVALGKTGTGYFRIEGKVIKRVEGNDFYGNEAVWSPCLCDEDEAPAWGFRTESLKAQIGGYVSLYHPVLEIKGIPILYMPYLKLPIKSTRQSGFLMPVIAQESKSGTIYSQPVYFVLGKNQDLTLTTEVWERRGTKLGFEWRYKQREHSGWTLKIEGIRDRLWLEERANRETIIEAEPATFQNCQTEVNNAIAARLEEIKNQQASGSPVSEELSEEEIQTRRNECEASNLQQAQKFATREQTFSVPQNTWRSAKIWRGMSILAPRVSFVSNGTVLSDHRYVEELFLPDSFNDIFNSGHQATYFADAVSQIHFDGKDYYIGSTSAFGDHVLLPTPYQGQQLPLKLDFASRVIDLDVWGISPLPLYGQVGLQHYRILDMYRPETIDESGVNQSYLGNGLWQRANFELTTPLLSDSIVGVDYFADAEARVIDYDGFLTSDRSTIRSWRTGVTFKLPMIGEAKVPGWLRSKETKGEDGIQHRMDWNITFSLRPSVVRDGPYADETAKSEPFQYYFISDTNRLGLVRENTDASAERDAMMTHRRIGFSTSHRWNLFERDWKLLPATAKKEKNLQNRETYMEQAKRELLFSLDRPVSSVDEMLQAKKGLPATWFINRYQYETSASSEILSLGLGVEYDFEVAEKRREKEGEIERALADARANNKSEEGVDQSLPEPLTPVTGQLAVNLAGVTMQANGTYNTYKSIFTETIFGLGLPAFYQTKLGFGLTIKPDSDNQRDKEYSAGISTALIPNVSVALNWGWKIDEVLDAENQQQESYAANIHYVSPSKCWHLNFATSKEFTKPWDNPEYLLEVGIIFLGQQRSVADLAPSITRDLRNDNES